MKNAPKRYVTTYHSRIPHSLICQSFPERDGFPASGLNTPSWHHTEETTRTRQLTEAKGTLSFSVCSAQSSGDSERIWKYMAKRPAKNISSLPSHTMVPTDTMLGRVAGPDPRCTERDGAADAVATSALWGQPLAERSNTPCRMGRVGRHPCPTPFASIGVMTDSHGGATISTDVAEGSGPGPTPVTSIR